LTGQIDQFVEQGLDQRVPDLVTLVVPPRIERNWNEALFLEQVTADVKEA
jgi:hypothetical protein